MASTNAHQIVLLRGIVKHHQIIKHCPQLRAEHQQAHDVPIQVWSLKPTLEAPQQTTQPTNLVLPIPRR